MAQDRLLEILQHPGRLEPELVDERAPRVLVDRQRLGLPAGAIEREHERPARPLAEWMLANERLEFPDQTSVPAERELGLDPLLEGFELQLIEAEDLAGRKALRSEFAERPAAPERESFPKPAQRIVRRQLPRLADELLEPLEVELAGIDAQRVSRSARVDAVLTEQLPKLRDVDLKALGRTRRRPVAPQQLDQQRRRKNLVRVQ